MMQIKKIKNINTYLRQRVILMKCGDFMYIIMDSCTLCGLCVKNCPVAAIRDGNNRKKINHNMCIECGICETVCPSNAIEKKEK